MIGALEVLSDRDGAVVFGWVYEDVLYAQLIERLSSPLGMRYASRLEEQLQTTAKVRAFLDWSGLDTYDHCARNALQRVLFVHRRRVASVLVLAHTRIVELGAQVVGAHLPSGMLQVTRDRSEFVAALDRVAPMARRYVQSPIAWVQPDAHAMP